MKDNNHPDLLSGSVTKNIIRSIRKLAGLAFLVLIAGGGTRAQEAPAGSVFILLEGRYMWSSGAKTVYDQREPPKKERADVDDDIS